MDPHGKAGRLQAPLAAAQRLAAAVEAEGYVGWDPYDALSSPLLRACARTRSLRLAAVQACKRSPLNTRCLLGVPRRRHIKALALFTSADSLLSRTDDGDSYRARALELADEVAHRALSTQGGASWGYEFDVQTRWGYYRAGEPNAVVTAFAGHALLDAADLSGSADHAALARSALDYASNSLIRSQGGERYFAYYAGSETPIHNASLLIAGLAARCADRGSDRWQEAEDSVAYTLARQRADGSWPYGETPGLDWVDGYHTAYVLESLARWHEASGDVAVLDALRRGLDLYLSRLVDPDGAPRATTASRYPLDIHSASSGIAALCMLARYDVRPLQAAGRILDWTLAAMLRSDGRFAYQRHRLFRNSIPYIRWSDAHMLRALAAYISTESGRGIS